MISLMKLSEMSEQQVFNHVVAHLRKQGEQSLNNNGVCAYRGTDGKMCAAGSLIADHEYFPMMDDNGEGLDWQVGIEAGYFPDDHSGLITQLQGVHDGHVHNWERGFADIAERFNLEYTHPEDV